MRKLSIRFGVASSRSRSSWSPLVFVHTAVRMSLPWPGLAHAQVRDGSAGLGRSLACRRRRGVRVRVRSSGLAAQSGTVREAVRQELVARQLEESLPADDMRLRILDAGGGQGTQALRPLVSATESWVSISPNSRSAMLDEPQPASLLPSVRGWPSSALICSPSLPSSPAALTPGCCHGVLMYLPRHLDEAAASLIATVCPGGIVQCSRETAPAWRCAPGCRATGRRRWTPSTLAAQLPARRERRGTRRSSPCRSARR